MQWMYVLIVLVPLLVWVLTEIFRRAEEAKAPARRAGAPDGEPRVVPRRAASELDRFLEEAQKRRAKAAAPPVLELAPEPPAPPPPVVANAPAPRPRKEEPKPRPRRERERAEPERAAPRAAPAPGPAAGEGPRSAAGEGSPPARPAARPGGAVLARLGEMLRDRNALAAALVLREVLDRPLCGRRRR